jgi:hypothetical protein
MEHRRIKKIYSMLKLGIQVDFVPLYVYILCSVYVQDVKEKRKET